MKVAIYNKNQLNFFPLYAYTADINSPQPKIVRPCGYKEHQIFMVSRGNGILNAEGQTFTLEENDFFYLCADVPHEYYGTDPSFSTTYLSFWGEGFENIKKYYNLKSFGVYKNKNRGVFKASVKNLFNSIDVHEVSTLCSLTFSTIISFFDEACQKEHSAIEAVYKYIEENYSKRIALDDILTRYPYSKAKLCRDFKKKYNLTIFEAVTNIRLYHAHHMIKANPQIKLERVASLCGFNDVSYFCKMYKRAYNSSPKS